MLLTFRLSLISLFGTVVGQGERWRFRDLFKPYRQPNNDRIKEIASLVNVMGSRVIGVIEDVEDQQAHKAPWALLACRA